jgi:hypothetical protein
MVWIIGPKDDLNGMLRMGMGALRPNPFPVTPRPRLYLFRFLQLQIKALGSNMVPPGRHLRLPDKKGSLCLQMFT